MSKTSSHSAGLKRALVIFGVGLVLLLAGAALSLWMQGAPARKFVEVTSSGVASIGGPFQLVDHKGEPRSEADFRGRYMLIYFGYTYCPDVCPVSLTNMTQALDRLENQGSELGRKVVPIFMTVDPERDTVEALAAYSEHFHPSMVHLTGTPEQVTAAAKAYRVYFKKVEDDSASDYLMDHSSYIYLMGPDGAYLTHFTHNSAPEDIAAGLQRHLGG